MAIPTTGGWYWEITNTAVGDIPVWGLQSVNRANAVASGVPQNGTNFYLGYFSDEISWFNKSSAVIQQNQANLVTGLSLADGDVLMFAYKEGKIWIGKNGSWLNSGNPAAGTGNLGSTLTQPMVAAGSPRRNTGGTAPIANANFGQRPWAYAAPSGFKALCTQNLPTTAIGATSTTQANQFFNPVLYTGNSGTQSVNVGFQPDFVWIKRRDASNSPRLFDAVRGSDKYLLSDSTAAESSFGYLSGFTSTGFTLFSGDNSTNASGGSYVSWNWKANGAGSSNTAGSVTAMVSANTTSGFSVVTWTGSSAGQTVGHGLGVAPSLIIAKTRNNAGESWPVYHKDLGVGNYLFLNSTAAANSTYPTYWGSSAPSSTVFGTFTGGYPSANNYGNMVAYCFAPVAGYSAFGSYTGNGSADGPMIYLGFRPRYILLKGSSNASSWYVHDTARDTYNVTTNSLYPNLSAAEDQGYLNLDILSNGFKLRTTTSNNASGTIYVYAAFAETPFKYSRAR
ncbi:hypothetical protein EBZ39_14475 [bacterium]|nr:hypothetical protein [bacterium]